MTLGISVMLGILRGSDETQKALGGALDKEIKAAELVDDALVLKFTDGTGIRFVDDGQSCCESRYMVIDDNLSEYSGAKFLGAEIKDAPNIEDEYGDHEVQFLEVMTSKGPITAASHNEHNGYYGGFDIVVYSVSD